MSAGAPDPTPDSGPAGTATEWNLSTIAVTAGRPSGPGEPFNVAPTLASTYRDGGEIGYGRWGNPTWTAFEEALGALEGGRAVAFGSGMAAINAVLGSLPPGASVMFPTASYTGTRA